MSSETVKTPEYWGGIIQDPGRDYTSFDDIAKAIQDDATQSLRTQLAEKEAGSAVMRQAIHKVNEWYDGKHEFAVDFLEDIENQLEQAITSTSAGKAYLARMEEAERRIKQLEGFKVESSVILDERDQLKIELTMVGEDRDCARTERDKLKAQLEEARWLLVHCPNCMDPDQAVLKEWWQRRDTLLEQLKGGM